MFEKKNVCTWLVHIWCKYSYLNDLFCISVILNGKVGKNMTHHNHNLTLITRKHYNKRNCVVALFCTVGKNVPTHHPCKNYSVWHFIEPWTIQFGIQYQLCLELCSLSNIPFSVININLNYSHLTSQGSCFNLHF